jgi:hypothetical protein
MYAEGEGERERERKRAIPWRMKKMRVVENTYEISDVSCVTSSRSAMRDRPRRLKTRSRT